MRKVLLATTALVAMSVTAAQAQQSDVNISGNIHFEVADNGTATTFTTDGNLNVVGSSTTDSGLTLTAFHGLTTQTAAGGGGVQGVDDSYLNIAGDFGNLRMGNTDDVLDLKDGLVPSNWDESGNGGFAIGGQQGAGEATISFTAPTISGVSLYGMTSAEGDESGMGVNYSTGPVAVMYQMGDDGTDSETLMAANFTMAGATVGFSSGENTTLQSVKTKATSMGVKYQIDDLSLYYTSQKDAAGEKTKTAFGAYYAIAPGLQGALETADDGTNNTATYAHLKVSF